MTRYKTKKEPKVLQSLALTWKRRLTKFRDKALYPNFAISTFLKLSFNWSKDFFRRIEVKIIISLANNSS